MTPEQWLTPTLVAAYPGFQWIVRTLLVLAAVEIGGGVGFGVLMTRSAHRLDSSSAAATRDVARRLAKARVGILVSALPVVVLWTVGSAVFGFSALRNELLLVVTLGLVMMPAYVLLGTIASAMRRSADIGARGGGVRAG
jgi:hypothetical protein